MRDAVIPLDRNVQPVDTEINRTFGQDPVSSQPLNKEKSGDASAPVRTANEICEIFNLLFFNVSCANHSKSSSQDQFE